MPFYNRKPTRLPGYDYSSHNYYFITICTNEKKCIFGQPEQLNQYGMIVDSCIQKINSIFPSITVDKYVIMPNHVHMILICGTGMEKTKLPDISTVVGQFKMAVTRQIRKLCPQKVVWQRSFHDHIIRTQEKYTLIWNYIDGNLLKWNEDRFYVYEPQL